MLATPKFDNQPMLLVAAIVAQKARRVGDCVDQQVEIAVVVVIGDCGTAANVFCGETRAELCRDIDKTSSLLIAEHLIGLIVGEGDRGVYLVDQIEHVSIGDKEIQVGIVVVVEKY